jgi:hypothetical protein
MRGMRRARALMWLMVAAASLVCAAQLSLDPATPSEAARVVAVTGQVSVLHDSQPWALNTGDDIKLGQVIISGPDGFAVFQLSDGSTFEVYSNSRVIFRKTPGNLKDLLDVLLGRVRVHIQKWGGQPNYNRIFTPTAVISVRGTVFDVEVEDADDTTLVVVEEGLVEVQHARHPGTPKLLGAGEWLRIYKNQPLTAARLDKGSVLNATFRAIADALYTVVYRNQRMPNTVGVSQPSGGGVSLPGDTTPLPPPTLPGDKKGGAPPPPPPSPPPGG